MRVEPLMQLSEAITSFFEAVAYPSMMVLAVILLVVGALELRSRMRRSKRESNTGDHAIARRRQTRRRTEHVAPAGP